MRRLVLLSVVVGALIAAPAVLADTPLFATTDGGTGAVHGNTQYVLYHSSLGASTVLSAVPTSGNSAPRSLDLPGYWYFPNTIGGAGGLSHDGKTLLLVDLVDKRRFAASTFLVVDLLRMKLVRTFTPYASIGRRGPPFALTDALSPDASRLYAVEYTNTDTGVANPCFAEYGYDLGSHQRVSIRTDNYRTGSDGTPMTRTTSANGRWVYTLYREASGASFIQVLDTVGAAVHCVYLPTSDGADLAGISLGNNDRMLAVSSGGGTPKLDVAVGSWRVSQAPAAPFPWVWLAAGLGGFALVSAGGVVLWRRRNGEVDWLRR